MESDAQIVIGTAPTPVEHKCGQLELKTVPEEADPQKHTAQ